MKSTPRFENRALLIRYLFVEVVLDGHVKRREALANLAKAVEQQ